MILNLFYSVPRVEPRKEAKLLHEVWKLCRSQLVINSGLYAKHTKVDRRSNGSGIQISEMSETEPMRNICTASARMNHNEWVEQSDNLFMKGTKLSESRII